MHSEGLISSDQKLPFADQFSSSCLGWGGGQWNYPSATETSFVSTGMDRALAARMHGFPERKSPVGQPGLAVSARQALCPVIKRHSLPDRVVGDFPSAHVVASEALTIPDLKEKRPHFLPCHYGKRKLPLIRCSKTWFSVF